MANKSKVLMGQLNILDKAAKYITLCVTEDCNLACTYCYLTGKNHTKKMNFDTAKKAIDYILSDRENFNDDFVVWDFIGGEPFLEIELIDRISDYIKHQMFLLDHPWLNGYRFSFSTNGLLYHTDKVQEYIQKNRSHISIGMSVDGNKLKHDISRVKPDGSGSYDDVIKNVPLWLEQFKDASTKSTFSHDDLPYLKDSIIHLWELGIKYVPANVVFEDVWHEGDDVLYETQLKELADYIIENKLWDTYSVRFFAPTTGHPLPEETLKNNFCGAGKMMTIDCEGNFYPCFRFLDFSLNNRKGIVIGNSDVGIDKDKIRPFLALNVPSQSNAECVNCEVASSCSWCQGCNYDMADTDTIYQRATFICKMHKANVRANKYFWDSYSEVTGLPSPWDEEQEIVLKADKGENIETKFLQFITSDDITPHCSYRNWKGTSNIMSGETLEKGLEFAEKNNFVPVMLGVPNDTKEEFFTITGSKTQNIPDGAITVYDNNVEALDNINDNCILLINKANLSNAFSMLKNLFNSCGRVNLILEDIDKWKNEELEEYKRQLDLIIAFISDSYRKEEAVELNILTDIWDLKHMRNCEAGNGSFALAPNGKLYMCPAFYFDNRDDFVGTLEDGINIKNPQLLEFKNAPICSNCDVYNCKRCKYLNKKLTGEYHIPSKIQCVTSHMERNKSRELQKSLRKEELIKPENILLELEYNDPLEVILAKKY
jgi:uncharacterized protein